MYEEARIVLSSPVFILLVAGYSAYCAVIIGLMTFGSAIMLGLGFFEKQTAASVTLGAVASLAGVLGTPLGGVFLGPITKREAPTRVEGESDASHTAKLELFKNNQLSAILSQNALQSLAGMLLLLWGISMDKWGFLMLLCVGLSTIFCTQSGVNISSMLAVPEENRSFAIAVLTLLIHLFGDVPSPIIVGYLKDKFAPHCTVSSLIETIDPECEKERGGLRLLMSLVSMWLVVMIGGFFAGVCVCVFLLCM
eukprot:GDKI01044101.1.p1 GENE.GDKI01044101.1~~GDKI01044101.1.p1  ORF type:complete len:261 (+),score=88.95 GDKI01044101.1:30-785(+)